MTGIIQGFNHAKYRENTGTNHPANLVLLVTTNTLINLILSFMNERQLFRNWLLLLVTGLCLAACNGKKDLTHEDTLKIQELALKKYFGNSFSLTPAARPDYPVKTGTILSCIDDYQALHPKTEINRTYAVGFDRLALINYLTNIVTKNPNTQVDSIRIEFGLYNAKFLSTAGLPINPVKDVPGRLTVFLCPYFKGKRATVSNSLAADSVDSFNIGSLYP